MSRLACPCHRRPDWDVLCAIEWRGSPCDESGQIGSCLPDRKEVRPAEVFIGEPIIPKVHIVRTDLPDPIAVCFRIVDMVVIRRREFFATSSGHS